MGRTKDFDKTLKKKYALMEREVAAKEQAANTGQYTAETGRMGSDPENLRAGAYNFDVRQQGDMIEQRNQGLIAVENTRANNDAGLNYQKNMYEQNAYNQKLADDAAILQKQQGFDLANPGQRTPDIQVLEGSDGNPPIFYDAGSRDTLSLNQQFGAVPGSMGMTATNLAPTSTLERMQNFDAQGQPTTPQNMATARSQAAQPSAPPMRPAAQAMGALGPPLNMNSGPMTARDATVQRRQNNRVLTGREKRWEQEKERRARAGMSQ